MIPLTSRKQQTKRNEPEETNASETDKYHGKFMSFTRIQILDRVTANQLIALVGVFFFLFILVHLYSSNSNGSHPDSIATQNYLRESGPPIDGFDDNGSVAIPCPNPECKPSAHNAFGNKCSCPCAAVSWTQGPRPYQEDRFYLGVFLFGIFDGHGGYHASSFAALNLHKKYEEIRQTLPPASQDSNYYREGTALSRAFDATDQLLETHLKSFDPIREDGTTALVALFTPDMKKIIVSWVGDSRAVAGFIAMHDAKNIGEALSKGKDWEAIRLSNDHKPVNKERERIVSLGGFVQDLDVPRVQGTLAMSRALGDYSLRPYISAQPEFTITEITVHHQFVVMASDGLWDVMNDLDVVRFVGNMLVQGKTIKQISEALVNGARDRGTYDNVTVLILDLRGIANNC